MRKIEISRKPDDESGSAPDDSADSTESTSKRKNVSKRYFLDAAGSIGTDKEPVRIEDAKGARYMLLDPAGNHNIDYNFGVNADEDRMFALFGFHTKIGNVANTVLNDKDDPGTPADAKGAIDEFRIGLQGGTWAERAAGGPGARIDKDALAGAIVEVAAAAGHTLDLQKVRDRLESDAKYVRDSRQVGDVATAYSKRVGKPAKSIADLLM